MSDTTSRDPHAPPPADADHGGNPPLVRTVDDRVVSGVSGGLGRHFGVDPVIFRVVFTVLALFGGLGVLLYGLGWLLMPADDHPTPLARGLLNGRDIAAAVPPVAITAIGTGIFFAYLDGGFDTALPPLIVATIILYACHHRTRRDQLAAGIEPVPLGGTGARPPAAPHPANAAGGTEAMAPAGAAKPAAGPSADQRAHGAWAAPGPVPWWRRPTGKTTRAPEPRRARSHVTPAVVSLAAVAGGVLWWLDTGTSADVSVQVGLAVILAVLAGGLLAGAFLGGGRWLILPAFAVAVAVSAAAALTVPLTGPSGERRLKPATADAVDSPYRMKFGELDIDLTRLDFAGRDPAVPVHVVATVGVGGLTVRVPDDVRVVVNADADLGTIDFQDRSDSGYKPERNTVIEPRADRPTRGTITLDLGIGVGNLEVLHGTP